MRIIHFEKRSKELEMGVKVEKEHLNIYNELKTLLKSKDRYVIDGR